jgi:DNA-binding protein HU-beta
VRVNKRDLVGKIAAEANLTRAQATRALDALLAGIQSGLRDGHRITLSGFGSFAVSDRKARSVRDPRRGVPIHIDARRIPRFAPGLDLKAAVNRSGDTLRD